MGEFVKHKFSIAVDFDGVLHSYTTPWINAHTIPDPPVEGAIRWLWDVVQKFDVYILSTRCKTWRGRKAIRAWVKEHAGMLWYEGMGGEGIEAIKCTFKKVPCLIYIDDRGYRFTGDNFPTVDEIHRAKPWMKA